MNQLKKITLVLTLLFLANGCASSSDIERKARMHAKAGEYYESVGQLAVAREEYRSANKSWDTANDLFPVIVELFNLFTNKKKN